MHSPVVLSIAGSDPSGGAGIQADLRVFARHELVGTTVITALTAQNPKTVAGVVGTPSEFVRLQLDTLAATHPIHAIKVGMLWSVECIITVTDWLMTHSDIPVVVDPVMVSTSGSDLLNEDAIEIYRSRLLPRAQLATPNLDEAAILLGNTTIHPHQQRECAHALMNRFGCPFLLKGGHLPGDPVDVFVTTDSTQVYTHPRVTNINTHGSGCILSAAICCQLACGQSLATAVTKGLNFVHDALVKNISPFSNENFAGIEYADPNSEHLTRLSE